MKKIIVSVLLVMLFAMQGETATEQDRKFVQDFIRGYRELSPELINTPAKEERLMREKVWQLIIIKKVDDKGFVGEIGVFVGFGAGLDRKGYIVLLGNKKYDNMESYRRLVGQSLLICGEFLGSTTLDGTPTIFIALDKLYSLDNKEVRFRKNAK